MRDAMKWRRGSIAGEYKSGDMTIRGSQTDWKLMRGGKIIKALSSKRSCQEYAAVLDEDEYPDKLRSEVDVEVPQQRNRGTQCAPSGSLESVLASLRLDVERLTDMIGLLAKSITDLTAKIDSLRSRKA